MSIKDNIYENKLKSVSSFKFDAKVAHVFDDMIQRSVPGYKEILKHAPVLCEHYTKGNGRIYDLGCSTGAGLFAMNSVALEKNATIYGIDNSQAMIDNANAKLNLLKPAAKRELICADILDIEITKADFVLMNYTLQFIEPAKRQALLGKIYQGMTSNSALVLSEKTHIDDTDAAQEIIDLHHRFKAHQGYSELEIAQKRDAIENVLIPESLQTHVDRLRRVGFNIVIPWLRHFQFVSILAVKK